MTTGNVIIDRRVSTPSGLEGSYYRKVWSGGDQLTKYPKNQHIFKPFAINRRKHPNFVRPYRSSIWNRPPSRGLKDPHAYSMSLEDHGYYRGTLVIGGSRQPPEVYSNYFFAPLLGGVSVEQLWTDNDDLYLLSKLRDAVAGSSFNAAVTLAEGFESAATITDAATRIYKGLYYLNRGNLDLATRALTGHPNRNQARSKPRTVAHNWLNLQYGWMPLLKDIEEAAKFLAHLNSVPLQQSYTVTHKVNGKQRVVGVVDTWVPGHSECYKSVRIKAIIREVDIVKLVGLTDPLSVAWEKLPYSFVADWILPVGSFLQARSLDQALRGTYITTEKVVNKWRGYGNFTDGPRGGRLAYDASSFSTDYFTSISLNRTVGSSLYVPMPAINSLSKVASWRHAINAVALVSNRAFENVKP